MDEKNTHIYEVPDLIRHLHVLNDANLSQLLILANLVRIVDESYYNEKINEENILERTIDMVKSVPDPRNTFLYHLAEGQGTNWVNWQSRPEGYRDEPRSEYSFDISLPTPDYTYVCHCGKALVDGVCPDCGFGS